MLLRVGVWTEVDPEFYKGGAACGSSDQCCRGSCISCSQPPPHSFTEVGRLCHSSRSGAFNPSKQVKIPSLHPLLFPLPSLLPVQRYICPSLLTFPPTPTCCSQPASASLSSCPFPGWWGTTRGTSQGRGTCPPTATVLC